jgi:predicted glycogen debranching enzyme
MAHGRASLGVVHRLLAGPPVGLALEALCTWRDAHGERSGASGPLAVTPVADGAVVEGAYRLAGPGWQPGGEWYRGARLREEAARGLAAEEDLWYAGRFTAELSVFDELEVSAWAGDLSSVPPPASAVVAGARSRIREVVLAAGALDAAHASLVQAADAFVVACPSGPDVVAGYPWFGAWSRDTMISYEGLFLATLRAAEGRELLRAYAATLSDGMLANTADTGHTEYNTVDGTLWFVHAVDRHVETTGDTDLAHELLPALDAIVAAHLRGARYGIGADPADGLLTQGAPGYALTWMDARVDGVGVTPRTGKPVEVNALWVNALWVVATLRGRLGLDGGPAAPAADRAAEAFGRRFRAPDGWLYDVVDGPDGDDPALRPNQVLAYALPYGPLRGEPVPDAVGAALLTPLGLRTLAPGAPGYRGAHRGGPAERDAAYHQGTVWPWLVGPYADARRAAGQPTHGLLDGLLAHLPEHGLGSVSETADGDAPHAATGCPFQAWSVAELLRVRAFG